VESIRLSGSIRMMTWGGESGDRTARSGEEAYVGGLRQKDKMKETRGRFKAEAVDQVQRYVVSSLASFEGKCWSVAASVTFRITALGPRRRSRPLLDRMKVVKASFFISFAVDYVC
jgi:hypothetical protein